MPIDRVVRLIRQAPTPELQTILTVAAEEVRRFLDTDRVKIYQFHADGSGEVVAESLNDSRLPSLLGLHFPADDIPQYARDLFVKARMRSVVDVTTRQIAQSLQNDPESEERSFTDLRYRPLDPCHAEYLTAMGVKSSLVVPLFENEELWGLLVSHHADSREIAEAQLEEVQRVTDLLCVAIAQAGLLDRARENTDREAKLNRIGATFPKLQQALEETVRAFDGSGGRLYIKTSAFEFRTAESAGDAMRLYTCGVQPVLSELSMFPTIEQYHFWEQYFQDGDRAVWAIADLYRMPELRVLQSAFRSTPIRSILTIALHQNHRIVGYVSIFRDAIDTERLWAGRVDSDERQELPRASFEAWKQTQTGQVRAWTTSELKLARTLSDRFSTAVEQYEMHKQLSSLNTTLEKQVEERTEQLTRAFERQQALFEGVAKMRESLDLKTIFQTTTREVRNLLNADRVSVYRFHPDWGGEFLNEFESCGESWQKIGRFGENSVWNDSYLQDTQGGRYRHAHNLIVEDVCQANFSPCHLEILQQFQIRAFATVPIFVGQSLWGILGVYQHSNVRKWEAEDVRFLEQIAAQMGVTIQQANLLDRTQQQAEQLEQTIAHLQATQAQLVQTEKMSSLGQLVAGIAHEINNPVNFIYGNLIHTDTYVKDILNLLSLYQQHVDRPHPDIIQAMEDVDLEFLVKDLPKMLVSMKVGADRIRKIVRSLRNFSRLDEAERKDVDLHEGIESTLLILQHRLKAKSGGPEIQVIKNYGSLPLFECYAGQMNQVLMNILSNAIDAIEYNTDLKPGEGIITITTEVVKKHDNRQYAAIRIADNGAGIPDSVKDRIFDPFFTTKPIGRGTGLGLSISYQIIVDRHGGTFECQSQPGRGTQFEIAIPIR
ncbi:MAG TPA: GAF domain-containing protein [Oscillatoriales cyanobacterium M4454_W2019_049]|nr:GAF domain-containing protein [Oscillatoriales cyanobacterium M4454_W2019_049]